MKKSEMKLFSSLVLYFFLFPVVASNQLLTDKLMSGIAESSQTNAKFITWSAKGNVYWFDADDKIILEKNYRVKRLIKVGIGASHYYLLTSKYLENTNDTVLKINTLGKVLSEWKFNQHITSLNINSDKISVIINQSRFFLLPNGRKKLAEKKVKADFLLGAENNLIRCKKPDLRKLSYRQAVCSREGAFPWIITGQWRNINWPILCRNFFVETGYYRKFSKNRLIKVSDAATGKEIIKKSIFNGRVIRCSGNNLMYSGKTLMLADIKTLKLIKQVNVKNLPVWNAISTDTGIYYIDGLGKLFKNDF